MTPRPVHVVQALLSPADLNLNLKLGSWGLLQGTAWIFVVSISVHT